MKKRILVALLFASLTGTALIAQNTIPASAKTQEAIALGIVSPSTDEEMLVLNTKAEKLVWVEAVKGTVQPENVFPLVKHTGEEVVLTLEQLLNINPLLYELPQQVNRCENLLIQTADGSYHMLVVRSETMMANEIKRASIKTK
jgi:hypothetical protein